MAAWKHACKTMQGMDLDLKLLRGSVPLVLTKARTGSGSVSPVELTMLADVESPVQELPIQAAVECLNEGTVRIPVILKNTQLEKSYNMRQLGVYAEDPDAGEILYIVLQSEEDEKVPSNAEVKDFTLEWYLNISVGNAENVEVVIDETCNLTIDQGDARYVKKSAGKDLSSNDYTNEEKGKLKNIDENANNYTHPTDAGNKHIPPGGSEGQVLKYNGSSGTATWGDVEKATKATQDGSGNVIEDTYAKKSIYGDSNINMGRKSGSTVGYRSFTFGNNLVASGQYSFAEGEQNSATGSASHVENYNNTASGDRSHAEGFQTTASGANSHTEGLYSRANNFASHVSGKFNKTMTSGGADTTQVGDVFVIGNGTGVSKTSNALRVTYTGDVMGTKAFQSSGADYAEFIKPWADGNEDEEDRVGYFVTVRDGMLYKANEGDYIAGITSGNPSIVGNADEDYYWRYERDEFNRIVMEDVPEEVQVTKQIAIMQEVQRKDEAGNPLYDEDGTQIFDSIPVLDEAGNQMYEEVPVFDEETHEPVMVETGKVIKNARMKLSDDYDPSLQESYIERKNRKEWDYVGMLGVLPVRDDGTCIPGEFCRCGKGGIATLTEKRGIDTYMVIGRIAEHVVSVILK